MSECVVRMEMPFNCLECPMYDWNRQKLCCNAHLDLRPIPNGGAPKPDWCPIICQLPEGHGRLVDADKEIDFHVNDYERVKTEGIDMYSKAYSLSDFCDGITYAYDHANIIVPAEAERSET